MKALLAVLLFASTSAFAADSVHFERPTSWEQVRAKAKEQGKFLFLDAYTDWCYWCKVMDAKTFTDAKVIAFMEEKFVSAKVEMETGFGNDLRMKYRIHSFPEYLIFTPEGEFVYRISGYQTPADFIPQLENSLNPATQTKFPGISYPLDVGFPEFLRTAYGGKERVQKWPEQEKVVAWLDAQSAPTTEAPWTVLSRLSFGEKWNNWIIEHRAELTAKYGAEVDIRIQRLSMGRMTQAIEAGDNEALMAAIDLYPDTVTDPYKAEASADMRVKMAMSKKKWDYAVDILEVEYKLKNIDGGVVNNYSWQMYEECDETLALMGAIGAMKKVVEDDAAGSAEWDTYAALLFKVERYDQAETSARKAIDMAKEADEDATDTEELLEKIIAARGS